MTTPVKSHGKNCYCNRNQKKESKVKNPEKYLHAWELNENSLLIRFYLFWYMTDEDSKNQITFCKLFWAVVCAPLMGIVWLVLLIGAGLFTLVTLPVNAIRNHWKSAEKPAKAPKPDKVAKGGARLIPRGVSWAADYVGAFFQAHAWVGKVIKWGLLAVAAIAIVGFTGWGIAALASWLLAEWSATVFLDVLTWIGICIGAILAISALGYGLAKTGVGAWIGDTVWRGLCFIGRGFRGVGRFFATGFYAIKYRTCPRVVVK